jgi:hypothetical protein
MERGDYHLAFVDAYALINGRSARRSRSPALLLAGT